MEETKYLSGARRLRPEDIVFTDDIAQNDNLLEFYISVYFNADDVFGTHVCNTDSDDWLNIYANYDMNRREVCEDLEVYIILADGTEQDYKYRLTEDERAFLLPKMEAFFATQIGFSLETACEQYWEEP